MAESSLQQLTSELSTHESKSQDCYRLFDTLFSGIVRCSWPATAAGPEPSATALVPLPDGHCRTHDSVLPDQATLEQVLAHIQQVFASHKNQSQQLVSVTQQLEGYSAKHTQATAVLQAATQLQDCVGAQAKSSPAELPQLAESVAAALVNQAGQLTQTQSQVEHLHEQLSQAQADKIAAKSELTTCKEQLCQVSHTAHTAQASLQQVIL